MLWGMDSPRGKKVSQERLQSTTVSDNTARRLDLVMIVFNYGGGRQTVAMSIMIHKGLLPRPDRAIMADTAFENPMTWEYLDKYVQPLLNEIGLTVEIASHRLATVKDIYAHNGDMILPAWTSDGKLRGFCSNEWKKRVVERYARQKGYEIHEQWLGLAFDEKRRWKRHHGKRSGKITTVCPLVDSMMDTATCLLIIENQGWPLPWTSSCYFCPHKKNKQWRHIRDTYPEQWEHACEIDEMIRDHNFNERNEKGGELFLHHSRVPLRKANLDRDDSVAGSRQCSLGMCFV